MTLLLSLSPRLIVQDCSHVLTIRVPTYVIVPEAVTGTLKMMPPPTVSSKVIGEGVV